MYILHSLIDFQWSSTVFNRLLTSKLIFISDHGWVILFNFDDNLFRHQIISKYNAPYSDFCLVLDKNMCFVSHLRVDNFDKYTWMWYCLVNLVGNTTDFYMCLHIWIFGSFEKIVTGRLKTLYGYNCKFIRKWWKKSICFFLWTEF